METQLGRRRAAEGRQAGRQRGKEGWQGEDEQQDGKTVRAKQRRRVGLAGAGRGGQAWQVRKIF